MSFIVGRLLLGVCALPLTCARYLLQFGLAAVLLAGLGLSIAGNRQLRALLRQQPRPVVFWAFLYLTYTGGFLLLFSLWQGLAALIGDVTIATGGA